VSIERRPLANYTAGDRGVGVSETRLSFINFCDVTFWLGLKLVLLKC